MAGYGSDRCDRLIVQSSAAAAARPREAASASTTKSSRRACRPGAQNCRISIRPVKATTKAAVSNRLRVMGQSESQSQQHEGKRMLAVLSEVRVRPLCRRPERREGDGGGEAPGE